MGLQPSHSYRLFSRCRHVGSCRMWGLTGFLGLASRRCLVRLYAVRQRRAAYRASGRRLDAPGLRCLRGNRRLLCCDLNPEYPAELDQFHRFGLRKSLECDPLRLAAMGEAGLRSANETGRRKGSQIPINRLLQSLLGHQLSAERTQGQAGGAVARRKVNAHHAGDGSQKR